MKFDAVMLHLQSVRIRNFKAIVDSRMLALGPLTAFIGHNGNGKSSLIEALETYKAIVVDGLDMAMQRCGWDCGLVWRHFFHLVLNCRVRFNAKGSQDRTPIVLHTSGKRRFWRVSVGFETSDVTTMRLAGSAMA